MQQVCLHVQKDLLIHVLFNIHQCVQIIRIGYANTGKLKSKLIKKKKKSTCAWSLLIILGSVNREVPQVLKTSCWCFFFLMLGEDLFEGAEGRGWWGGVGSSLLMFCMSRGRDAMSWVLQSQPPSCGPSTSRPPPAHSCHSAALINGQRIWITCERLDWSQSAVRGPW